MGSEIDGWRIASGFIGLLMNLIFPLLLFAWGRSVANKRMGRGWRLASYMPLIAVISSMLGFLLTVLGLLRAFSAVANVDPSEKASHLAAGISMAMWATAIGMGISVLLYVASIVTFAIGELTRPRAASPG
jgi:MotA/TolQ/ExbB proton channel family